MAVKEISMGEVKHLLNYFIDNNRELQEQGERPVSLGLEAAAGIGKTSIVEEVAKERGMNYVSICLSQFEEAGDLLGFPIKEYECQVGKKVKAEDGTVKIKLLKDSVWMNEKQLESPATGLVIKQTGKTRMGYAVPAWVPEYSENGTIVNMDDFTRGNPSLLQSCMEIVNRQEYASWKLPPRTTVVITANPDNGEYSVNSLEEAQRTRFMGFKVKFSEDAWARWTEEHNIDGRCINFVLNYSGELFNADDQGNRICNPRSFVMFARSIQGIKDWDNADNLAFINLLASGCFNDEHGRFGSMFTSFIRNKMHLLIQPKEMLLGSWDKTRQKLIETVYDNNGTGNFRADISSILERRFANYVLTWLKSDEKTPISAVKARIIDFLECENKYGKKLFNKDCFYDMIKKITSEKKSQTSSLLYDPRIATILQ